MNGQVFSQVEWQLPCKQIKKLSRLFEQFASKTVSRAAISNLLSQLPGFVSIMRPGDKLDLLSRRWAVRPGPDAPNRLTTTVYFTDIFMKPDGDLSTTDYRVHFLFHICARNHHGWGCNDQLCPVVVPAGHGWNLRYALVHSGRCQQRQFQRHPLKTVCSFREPSPFGW